MKVQISLIIVSIVFIFSSCFYDNKEELYILYNTKCDTVDVTYTKNIKSVFDIRCVNCHNGSATSVNLIDYTNSRAYATKQNTNLYTTVSSGAHHSVILSECELNQLRIWIASGANQ